MSPRRIGLRAALYARYSTEKQSENSVEDQFRVCTRLCEREGFTVVDRFADAGVSGGTANRPGYQRLLEAARQREFDVIVAEDTSRLWRELSEQWRALKELADLRIAVVTHDVDTRRQESKVLLSVTGAMSEAYRDEIARRTRRGLEGRAVAGQSAGGRAYGYIPASRSSTGSVEVHEAEAAVVRRIYNLYAEGASPRAIAAQLNAARIPSPGAAWQRREGTPSKRRNGKWMASAIHGDARKGTGLLNNERYRGVVVWGRMRWERGAADSAKRLATFKRGPRGVGSAPGRASAHRPRRSLAAGKGTAGDYRLQYGKAPIGLPRSAGTCGYASVDGHSCVRLLRFEFHRRRQAFVWLLVAQERRVWCLHQQPARPAGNGRTPLA